jgi:hypothetical protein
MWTDQEDHQAEGDSSRIQARPVAGRTKYTTGERHPGSERQTWKPVRLYAASRWNYEQRALEFVVVGPRLSYNDLQEENEERVAPSHWPVVEDDAGQDFCTPYHSLAMGLLPVLEQAENLALLIERSQMRHHQLDVWLPPAARLDSMEHETYHYTTEAEVRDHMRHLVLCLPDLLGLTYSVYRDETHIFPFYEETYNLPGVRALRRLYQLQEEAYQATRQAEEEERVPVTLSHKGSDDPSSRSRREVYRATFPADQSLTRGKLQHVLATWGYTLIATMHSVFDAPDGWTGRSSGRLRDIPIPIHHSYQNAEHGSLILYIAGEDSDTLQPKPDQPVTHRIGYRKRYVSILQVERGPTCSALEWEQMLSQLADICHIDAWKQIPAERTTL